MVDTIYEFTPNDQCLGAEERSTCQSRAVIYPPPPSATSSTPGGGSMFDPVAILVDSTDSLVYDPVADSIITIASIPQGHSRDASAYLEWSDVGHGWRQNCAQSVE